jgi:hypothetical protein
MIRPVVEALSWTALALAAVGGLVLGGLRRPWWWALMIGGALGVVIGELWAYREIGAERLVDPEEATGSTCSRSRRSSKLCLWRRTQSGVAPYERLRGGVTIHSTSRLTRCELRTRLVSTVRTSGFRLRFVTGGRALSTPSFSARTDRDADRYGRGEGDDRANQRQARHVREANELVAVAEDEEGDERTYQQDEERDGREPERAPAADRVTNAEKDDAG